MGMIEIRRLPIPPSINKQLVFNRGRFVKGNAARLFDNLIDRHSLIFFKSLNFDRAVLQSWGECELEIELFFVFHKDRVISKTKQAKSKYKSIDSNNRIKSAIDAVAKLLGFDDKMIFKETSHKVTCEDIKDEQLIVRLRPCQKITLKEIQ